MPTTAALLPLVCLSFFSQRPAPDRGVVVFFEAEFPAADTVAPKEEDLRGLLPGASLATAKQLPGLLARARLLVLPFGSAFPEEAWPAIRAFLDRGGNLLVLGGKPFARAARREPEGWRLRPESVRFMRPLSIDQYQRTPGSTGLDFQANGLPIARFEWTHAFSPLIHLSAKDLYRRDGSTGSIDARLDPLAWGVKDGRRLATPLMRIDHLRASGGRWIFLAAELPADFYSRPTTGELLSALVENALDGSEAFTVRPRLPLYLPGEPVELQIGWRGAVRGTVKITVSAEGAPPKELTVPPRAVKLPAPSVKGFHTVEAQLLVGGKVHAVYKSGFWIRDRDYLRSGPRLSVDKDYFQLDGQPLAVVGTTHMASDVQRLFFEYPNAHVWERDFAEMAGAGLNMVRTGWWTAWDKIADRNGRPSERTLRTLEAYLMTARRHGLPVQFTFFAFLPDVFGGANAYFDPKAIRRQRTLIQSVVGAFHDVPFVAWDLINEPSFSRHLWSDRPNGDRLELARWNDWLRRRKLDLAEAWNRPGPTEGTIPLPAGAEFEPRGVYAGRNSLMLPEYQLFAQESFADWARGMRETIRATGSAQLVTVGQDEGGFSGRPSPAFFAPAVDFTTNHSWWENDALLWDSLVAKQPGTAMLIQETGMQRELNLDESARRDPDSEAALVERKIALAFVQGAGALQWLWHTNSYMTQGNEVCIGAVRTDGSEKPEAAVVRSFARFARSLGPHLRDPERPPVAIVTSQAAQFSVIEDLQLEAQQAAVRALAYEVHQPGYVIAENQIGKLGAPKLAILPSAQALTETTWRALLGYVTAGGNLLVTGAVERDEHWHPAPRIGRFFSDAAPEPITYRDATLRLPGRTVALSFGKKAQTWLEALRFGDGAGVRDVAVGKGRLFWAAHPVELAEAREATAALYAHVLGRIGLEAPIRLAATPGVLVSPTILRDAVLYVIVSERADDVELRFSDRLTGAALNLRLPSRRAALALIQRTDGAVIAKYGF